MIDAIKRAFGMFDSSGLKYSIKHLRSIENKIPFWPIEKQALYVDEVTTSYVNDPEFLAGSLQDYSKINDWKALQVYFLSKGLSKFNTTAIGNAAYIVLHSKILWARIRCANILIAYKDLLEMQ